MRSYYMTQARGSSGMKNYVTYYKSQASDGITTNHPYVGQRGSGFLGNFFKNTVWPLLKKVTPYVLNKAGSTLGGVYSDYRSGEQDIKKIFKKNLKSTGQEVLEDLAKKVGNKDQEGSGMKRRRKRKDKSLSNCIKKCVKKKKPSIKRKKKPTKTVKLPKVLKRTLF